MTVRRGPSVRHRPKWLISPFEALAQGNLMGSDTAGDASWLSVGRTTTLVIAALQACSLGYAALLRAGHRVTDGAGSRPSQLASQLRLGWWRRVSCRCFGRAFLQ
jgi:hypothetical protein